MCALRSVLTANQADTVLTVNGGRRIAGAVATQGFKHSLVTVVAAALAGQAPVSVANCPDVSETQVLAGLVNALGGRAHLYGRTLVVDGSGVATAALDPDLASRIHGSVYLVPALLGRFGAGWIPNAGGCRIGNDPGGGRPVEQYADVFRRFGAMVEPSPIGGLDVTADRLTGCRIDLLDYTADRRLRSGPLYSGATKTALLTAAVAHGTTVLRHPYPKPDVTDLVDVLRGLGADIDVASPEQIVVHGRGPDVLRTPLSHTLVPDLIEVVTWICAGAVLGSAPLRVTGRGMARATRALAPEFAAFEQLGLRIDLQADAVVAHPAEGLKPIDLVVGSHGVFSDSQPFLALLAAHATGRSTVTDTVWANRFGYLDGLRTLGVDAQLNRRSLRLTGPWTPSAAERAIHATDLRAAAVLLLAALATPGTTRVSGTDHLVRGYADLPGRLRALGADVAAEPAKPVEEGN